MKNAIIKQLLRAKKMHVSVAKKNLSIAHLNLEKIRRQIEILEAELFKIKKDSTIRQEKALREALRENFNIVSHTRVCNVYKLLDEEILRQNKKIWQEHRAERDALNKIVKAQAILTKSMQKEEKISYVVDKVMREELVRNTIIDEVL
uniref:Flagellar FliJ protein n=1 Tax=uncultured organism TaxID=155900 RepID=E3T2Z2_9ZZZZ|nr:hypothetical protein [uncultured organism]